MADALQLGRRSCEQLLRLRRERLRLQQVHDVGERLERVVNLVRERVRHAAGGGETLGVNQPRHQLAGFALGGLAAGDVFDHPEHRGRGRVMVQQRDGELRREGFAVGAKEVQLDAVAESRTGDGLLELLEVALTLGGHQEVFERVAEELFDGGPEHLRKPLIGEHKAAIGGGVRHADGGLVEGGGETLLRELEFGFGANALLAPLGVGQLALNGGKQALEVALEHVIVRSGAHGVHGGNFIDGAGDDDERQVDAAGLDHRQRFPRPEARQRVVGNDEVPRARIVQRGDELRRGFDAARVHGEPGADEVSAKQHGVLLVVLNDEDTKRARRARV